MSFFAAYVLPFLYIALICFLLSRNKYLLQNGFSGWFIIIFFVAKCISGVINDYVSIQYKGDVLLYFGDGYDLYKTFLDSPPAFFHALLQMFSNVDTDLLNSHSGFIRSVFEAIKLLHFFANFLSFGNVYTNTILFNGVATLVCLRCWIFLNDYTGSKVAGTLFFLLPSSFFYTSNILKEGLCTVLMAALFPLCYAIFTHHKARQLIKPLMLFVLLFFVKFIIAVTFFMAVAGWWFIARYPSLKYRYIVIVSLLVITCFFTSKYIHPALDLPRVIAHRQQEFIDIKARSEIAVYKPTPDFKGFVKASPYAIRNTLFKPLPGEGHRYFFLINSIEMFCFWSALLWLAVRNKFSITIADITGLYWAMFFYAMANLLVIGYIVPNIGALVRYRSIFLPWVGLFFFYLFNGKQWLANNRNRLLKRLG